VPTRLPALFLALTGLWMLAAGAALAGGACSSLTPAEIALHPTAEIQVPAQKSVDAASEGPRPLHRLMAHSHVISWIRSAVRMVLLTRSAEPPGTASGSPLALQPGCTYVSPNGPVAEGVPLPRLRQSAATKRFEFAFATVGQTRGSARVARQLATRRFFVAAPAEMDPVKQSSQGTTMAESGWSLNRAAINERQRRTRRSA
jgi:hypothetical protein